MQSLRVFCKFNMTGASYPHTGVRSPPTWTNYFYVLSCHCWSCVLYLSGTDVVCKGQCFLTEICSDTQLMQKYRDISLKGGFLPHATLLIARINKFKHPFSALFQYSQVSMPYGTYIFENRSYYTDIYGH